MLTILWLLAILTKVKRTIPDNPPAQKGEEFDFGQLDFLNKLPPTLSQIKEANIHQTEENRSSLLHTPEPEKEIMEATEPLDLSSTSRLNIEDHFQPNLSYIFEDSNPESNESVDLGAFEVPEIAEVREAPEAQEVEVPVHTEVLRNLARPLKRAAVQHPNEPPPKRRFIKRYFSQNPELLSLNDHWESPNSTDNSENSDSYEDSEDSDSRLIQPSTLPLQKDQVSEVSEIPAEVEPPAEEETPAEIEIPTPVEQEPPVEVIPVTPIAENVSQNTTSQIEASTELLLDTSNLIINENDMIFIPTPAIIEEIQIEVQPQPQQEPQPSVSNPAPPSKKIQKPFSTFSPKIPETVYQQIQLKDGRSLIVQVAEVDGLELICKEERCNYMKFINKNTYLRHVRKYHDPVFGLHNPFVRKCHGCGFESKLRSNLQQHSCSTPNRRYNFKCLVDNCTQVRRYKKDWLLHLKHEHNIDEKSEIYLKKAEEPLPNDMALAVNRRPAKIPGEFRAQKLKKPEEQRKTPSRGYAHMATYIIPPQDPLQID